MAAEEPIPIVDGYHLSLDIRFHELTWSGTVEAEIRPASPVLRLDAEGLDVHRVEVDGTPAPWTLDRSAGCLIVPMPVPGPRARIRVDFSGRVDPRGLVGLYRSRAGAGYVLTTQCAPIGARRVFPCVDRPDRRAPIELTVTTEAELEVLSNTIARRGAEVSGRRTWAFAPTPSMATYLLYIGVGEFDRISAAAGPVTVSVLASKGHGEEGQFALSVAPGLLQYFEEYYGIPYPLPKMDLIGVSELSFGAMENWGAITFRDVQLLVDERSSELERRFTFDTIAHELAHQWFGNLVTMRWWDDIWLNESFATLMGLRAVDHLDPKLDARSDFLGRWTARALPADSLASTLSVIQPVHRPEDLSSIFDPNITYGKGASVLRMIESYLGEEPFRDGVRRFLRRHQGDNAVTADLWTALEEATGEPIPAMLGPWIERPGLPVIEARATEGAIELRQRRFSLDGRPTSEVWPIPLLADVDGTLVRQRFDTERGRLTVPPGATVHLNPEATGFYRVRYDDALYDRLLAGFRARRAGDQWSLLADLHAFVISGDVPFDRYARFVHAAVTATEYPIVHLLQGNLRLLAEWAPRSPPIVDLARTFLAEQFRRIGARGSPGEPVGTGVLREAVADSRVRIDEGFARELAELFVEWDRIDPDLRGAVAVGRARTDPRLAAPEIRHRLRENPSEGEARRLEVALAWVADPAEVRRTLDGILDGTVNKGHVPLVIIDAARNPLGAEVTWAWFAEHVGELDALFRSTPLFPDTVRGLIPAAGAGRLPEVERFFADHPLPEAGRGIPQGLELLRIAEAFRRRCAMGLVGEA